MADSPTPPVPALPQHLVIMGISGSGKTTIASALSDKLGWAYAEADEFHPPGNIRKMAAGTPLDDDDRWPWLDSIQRWMTESAGAGRSTIVTCSALKRAYRDVLARADGRVHFIHLLGNVQLISQRVATRQGHFMPASLLASQVDTLEPLHPDEPGLAVNNTGTPDEVAEYVIRELVLPLPDRR